MVPTVSFMTVIGSYAIRNSISDVVLMIILGVMGWVLGRFGFAASPIVLGLILGAIAEQGFVQGWTIGAAVGDLPGMFFGRPIPLAIIALTLFSLLYPPLRGRIFGRRAAAGEAGANVACAIISSDDRRAGKERVSDCKK